MIGQNISRLPFENTSTTVWPTSSSALYTSTTCTSSSLFAYSICQAPNWFSPQNIYIFDEADPLDPWGCGCVLYPQERKWNKKCSRFHYHWIQLLSDWSFHHNPYQIGAFHQRHLEARAYPHRKSVRQGLCTSRTHVFQGLLPFRPPSEPYFWARFPEVPDGQTSHIGGVMRHINLRYQRCIRQCMNIVSERVVGTSMIYTEVEG